jgi:hypothetical protein
MSPIVILYAAVLAAAALALWGAYRVLGTPSRLAPVDYRIVLEDVISSVSRSATTLRAALDAGPDGGHLDEVATQTRRIFQTGYYQTLRLRPATGDDVAVSIREVLGRGCEAYDWASRMIGSASARNPVILEAARRLMDAGDQQLTRAARDLSLVPPAGPGNSAR